MEQLASQLVELLKRTHPEETLAMKEDLSVYVNDLLNRYMFKKLAGAVFAALGELPPAWQMHLSFTLDL
jgi:hypothetical protein